MVVDLEKVRYPVILKKIATSDSGKSTSRGNNDIDREEYGNIAKYADCPHHLNIVLDITQEG